MASWLGPGRHTPPSRLLLPRRQLGDHGLNMRPEDLGAELVAARRAAGFEDLSGDVLSAHAQRAPTANGGDDAGFRPGPDSGRGTVGVVPHQDDPADVQQLRDSAVTNASTSSGGAPLP